MPQDAGGPSSLYTGPANSDANSAPPLGSSSPTSKSLPPSSALKTLISTSSAPPLVVSTSTLPAGSEETVVVQTVDGTVATGTFVPTTLVQYQSQTTATTITTTTTDSHGDPIVIPIVIGIGGIAWCT